MTRTVDDTSGADETAEAGAKLAVIGTQSAIRPPSDSAPTPTAASAVL
ncbi:hypothetical protein [Streptomyces canus]|nr:hypothetical protein [Streptomyces canus]